MLPGKNFVFNLNRKNGSLVIQKSKVFACVHFSVFVHFFLQDISESSISMFLEIMSGDREWGNM